MVPDADEALCAVLSDALSGRAAVSLDQPEAGAGAEPPSGPRVHALLAAIREETDGLSADWEEVRDADSGAVVGRRPPIRRFDLHYVLTAHAADAAAEHALLDAVILAVAANPRVPAARLPEALAGLGLPVPLRLADPADGPETRADRRVRLGVVVTVSLVPPVEPVAQAPREVRLGAGGGRAHRPAGRRVPPQPPKRTWTERPGIFGDGGDGSDNRAAGGGSGGSDNRAGGDSGGTTADQGAASGTEPGKGA